MNKQQWEDLARFCGGKFREDSVLGPTFDWHGENGGGYIGSWEPEADWNDFGPLWLKLEAWSMSANPEPCVYPWGLMERMSDAIKRGDQQGLMLAGCELGAAIGGAMREQEGEV